MQTNSVKGEMCNHFVTIRSACTQLRHDQVECIQRIATLICNFTTYQREYTIAQLQQQAVIMQKEQVQKRHVETKHRLEEAEVGSEFKRIFLITFLMQDPVK